MSTVVSLETFTTLPSDPWKPFITGSGALIPTGDTLHLINTDTTTSSYTNAQIDDYQGLLRRQFLWQPPLTLMVRARFSHPSGVLSGTAGFGFWNDPFMMTDLRRPALPRAIWFFYASPPSNMKLDQHTPGFGWKAATIDALRWPFFALAPFAPLAVPLMNIDSLYRLCWPIGQRAIHVSEQQITTPMTNWHTYTLQWQRDQATFKVDDRVVLTTSTAPRGPLGFVLWLDNQYMIVTPWGRFGYGLLAAPGEQWLEVSALTIQQG
jgi:hypothetical protein